MFKYSESTILKLGRSSLFNFKYNKTNIRSLSSSISTYNDKEEVPINHFEEFNFRKEILNSINKELGWKYPTTIQRKVFELASTKKNIIASAWTGQGKTGAYMIPIINQILETTDDIELKSEEADRADINYIRPKAIIMAPSSELARQVYKNFVDFSKDLDIKIGLIINEGSVEEQLESFPKKVDVLVCTPGRMLQHLLFIKNQMEKDYPNYPIQETKRQSILSMTRVNHFVIDECDKLLSLGHLPDVLGCWELISKPYKQKRLSKIQVMICSATIVKEVHGFIMKIAPHYKLLDLNENMGVPKNIKQIRYDVHNQRKSSLLLYLLRRKGKISLKDKKILVFVRTIQKCNRLSEALNAEGFTAASLHADVSPNKRDRVINDFKHGSLNILISTDIATRGLDLTNLNYVINYDLPNVPADYIHRVGRCGRAGREGTAISFVSKDIEEINRGNGMDAIRNEKEIMEQIEKLLEKSYNDKHCSRLETRKIPGPFLDVDDYTVIKKVAVNPSYRYLVQHSSTPKKKNTIKNEAKNDYVSLMNKYTENGAKRKGIVISAKDAKASLRGSK
ncbi:P-loop containing nucleoside triphosphate hydrolase protein [Neoconidiobolus thromboides FSU 785]|nr:P-loop containing nucleoside triphosphate hydrolase protein [Neoconidiobolus thromboides FSU 785]